MFVTSVGGSAHSNLKRFNAGSPFRTIKTPFSGARPADELDCAGDGEIKVSLRPANKRMNEEGGLVYVILDGKTARRFRTLRKRVNHLKRRQKRGGRDASEALTAARQRLSEFKNHWVARVYSSQ
jgi:hypothetical protein